MWTVGRWGAISNLTLIPTLILVMILIPVRTRRKKHAGVFHLPQHHHHVVNEKSPSVINLKVLLSLQGIYSIQSDPIASHRI